MLEKRTKVFAFVLLMFVLLATCISIASGRLRLNSADSARQPKKTPVRTVWVTLAQNQQSHLFEQLRDFAEKHTFAIRIAQSDPTGENFLVEMWREDVEIVGLDSGDPSVFKLWFYNIDEESPAAPSVFDELIVDLRVFIGEIPNTTFTEKE